MSQPQKPGYPQAILADFNDRGKIVVNAGALGAFSAASAVGTELSATVQAPTNGPPEGLYVVSINNLDTIASLTAIVRGAEVLKDTASASVTVYPELTRFSVALKSAAQVVVQGWLVGSGTDTAVNGQIAVQNDATTNQVAQIYYSVRRL